MTDHRALAAGAALFTVSAVYAAQSHAWLPAAGLVHGAGLLAARARRERAALRCARALAQRAELAARPSPEPPFGPSLFKEVNRGWTELNAACCLQAWLSRGGEHDPAHCPGTAPAT